MSPADELRDVLGRHFTRRVAEDGDRLPPAAIERILHRLGVGVEDLGVEARSGADALASALGMGIDEDTLLAVAQAYGRAISRIVDAETEIARRQLREIGPERRAEALDRFLHGSRPLAERLFLLVHAARLHASLRIALTDEGLAEPPVPRRAIALVDYMQSTPYLREAPPEETAAFVDRLYEVGLDVTHDRNAFAVKFAGDGVFFSGPERDHVVLAAVDAVRALDADAPLRARGGLAFGPVVRRAGDYFGYSVNLASRLTEAARPGWVLADAAAVDHVPDGVDCERVEVELRGLDGTFVCLALR